MSNRLLNIFEDVYGERFKPDLEHRIMLQKAVYLLMCMGLYVGDYGFYWDKYGPYSMELDYESINMDTDSKKEIHYTDFAKDCIDHVKEIQGQKNTYPSKRYWMEAIASIHYLLSIKRIKQEEVLERLKELKAYLNDDESNRLALNCALGLMEN